MNENQQKVTKGKNKIKNEIENSVFSFSLFYFNDTYQDEEVHLVACERSQYFPSSTLHRFHDHVHTHSPQAPPPQQADASLDPHDQWQQPSQTHERTQIQRSICDAVSFSKPQPLDL